MSVGLIDSLVPSGQKSSPDPMVTQIYASIWRQLRHYATMISSKEFRFANMN